MMKYSINIDSSTNPIWSVDEMGTVVWTGQERWLAARRQVNTRKAAVIFCLKVGGRSICKTTLLKLKNLTY